MILACECLSSHVIVLNALICSFWSLNLLLLNDCGLRLKGSYFLVYILFEKIEWIQGVEGRASFIKIAIKLYINLRFCYLVSNGSRWKKDMEFNFK